MYTGQRVSNHDLRPHYQALDYASAQLPGSGQLALSMHQRAAIKDYDMFRYYRALLTDFADVVHIGYDERGEMVIQNRMPDYVSARAIIENSHGIWLLHNPRQTDLPALDFYREWFSQHYRSCGIWRDAPQAQIAYYLKHEIPCRLIADAQPLTVDYESGARLGNAVSERLPGSLDIYLWWHEESDSRVSYSLQLFDAAGEKRRQVDAVIAGALIDMHSLDLRELPSGDYLLKLIVYDYETLRSLPGVVLADGRRFDRELLLDAISLAAG